MTSPLWRGRYRSAFAVAVSALFAAPLYLALVNVFKPADAIRAHPLALPLHDFTTSNVVDAAQLSLVQEGLKTSLIITVEDSGVGLNRSARKGTGTGLRTVRDRLEALFGSGASLALSQRAPQGVHAEIRIPLSMLDGRWA